MTTAVTSPGGSRVLIKPVIERARGLQQRVRAELPGHDGLSGAVAALVHAAEQAERVAASMKRPWSPHRLPVFFLVLALLALAQVLYWQFFHVSTLRLALPARDAVELRRTVAGDPRLDLKVVEVPGSREVVALLEKGEVDLGFVQGGVPLPRALPRLETGTRELVLFFLRDGLTGPAAVHRVLTSLEGEGSHSVAKVFFAAWGVEVEALHAWTTLTADPAWVVPPEVDAVFVVKDPGDEGVLEASARLVAQGFHLAPAPLGARAGRHDWLAPFPMPAGWLQVEPPLPPAPVDTWAVTTWLVAREGLTPRLLAQAAEVLEARPGSIEEGRFHFDASRSSDLFQGVDAFLSILLNIALAFLALLGLDAVAYRKQFHELNSLVSLTALLQSNKDLLGVPPAQQREHVLYLSLCSDLLSLVAAISGYYTQENSSLLFNNLSELVHQRSDSLKLNIQLKLLQAMVKLEPPGPTG